MWGNFGLKLQNSRKLPHIHARFHCDANEQSYHGKGYCFDLRTNLISAKVSVSHRKSTQMHARPGQTGLQVDPSFPRAFPKTYAKGTKLWEIAKKKKTAYGKEKKPTPFSLTPSPLLPNFLLTLSVLLRSPAFLSSFRSPPGKGKETGATQATFSRQGFSVLSAIGLKWYFVVYFALHLKGFQTAHTKHITCVDNDLHDRLWFQRFSVQSWSWRPSY